MDFSEALRLIKQGGMLARNGWNASDQFVVLQEGYPDGVPINENTANATGLPLGTTICFRPYLLLRTADGSFVPWAPTVSDVLAEDWELLHRRPAP